MHTDHTTEPNFLTFPCTEPVTVDCRWHMGDISLTATDTDTIEVYIDCEESWVPDCTVTMAEGGRLVVASPQSSERPSGIMGFIRGHRQHADLTVTVPRGSSLDLHVQSGDIDISSDWEDVEVECNAGEVSVGDCRNVSIRALAGDISLTRVSGTCTVRTTAGDIHCERADGAITLHSKAGDMTITELRGPATLHTAAGDQTIETIAAPVKVQVSTAAGDISFGIAAGLKVFSEVSTAVGSMDNRLTPRGMPADGEGHVHLSGSSSFGDITVHDA